MLKVQEEEKKGWSWLGFLFTPYYYAGYGNLKKGITYAIVGAFPLFGLIIAVIGGINAKKNLPIGKQKFKWINVVMALTLTIVSATAIKATIQSIKGSYLNQEVKIIKQSKLELCQTATIEEMVNSFMSNPSWKSDIADTGEKFVNISGDITYIDKPVKGVLQFIFSKNNNSFQYNAFKMNGIVQDNLIANELLVEMCKSVN